MCRLTKQRLVRRKLMIRSIIQTILTMTFIAAGEISTRSVLFICSHYLIRKGCEALALLTISPSIFRGYFTNLWTLFDLMAIILTMAAFAWNTKNPGTYRNGFNAFVVGLLWMKVVGFLKVGPGIVACCVAFCVLTRFPKTYPCCRLSTRT